MAYRDFKDLAKRAAANKVVRHKAFNVAKDSKYDAYKFFDKKTAGGIKSVPENEQLAQ